MTIPRKFSFSTLVLGLAALVLFWQLGTAVLNYAHLAQLSINFRYNIDYGEGPLLDQTLRLAAGESLYKNDFLVPPYTISNYPPVFLLAQVPFAWIFGPAYWYGRAISILSALLTALFIGLTLYTLTGNRLASVIGGLFLLTFPYIQFWSQLNRIDSLALALSWAGIFVLVRYADCRWGVPLGAAFLIASIYTRQSYALAAPAGIFIWLLAMRRFRKAFTLALLVGGISLALFLVINLLTQGGFFLNIVVANVNPFIWRMVRDYAYGLADHAYLMLALIAIFLVGERFTLHTRSWPLVLPYLIAAILSAITVGKDGSNVNYLFELAAALSLSVGAALDWMGRNVWLRAAVVAVLAIQVVVMVGWVRDDANHRITEKTDHEQEIAELFKVVEETDGELLTDEYMGLVPLAGKRIHYQPFEYKMLAEGGLWEDRQMIASIIDHQYSAILWYAPPTWSSIEARWTPRLRDAIRSSYRLEKTVANTLILKPRE